MVEFILAGGNHLHTALLVHNAIPRVAKKLISDFAFGIERELAKEPGWKVVCNTLASSPNEKYAELRWAPIEWEAFGWGLSLSPQQGNARDFIFGVLASSADNPDPNSKSYPAMPDVDRTRLGGAIGPLLASIGDKERASAWMPRYTFLRTIKHWTDMDALMKIAFANGMSTQRDLVSGKPMNEFITDLFRASKAAITEVLGYLDIRPVSR